MIWRLVSAYAELSGAEPATSQSAAYALFDGVFQQVPLRYVGDSEAALDELRENCAALLPRLVM
jgi:hypothetical protein